VSQQRQQTGDDQYRMYEKWSTPTGFVSTYKIAADSCAYAARPANGRDGLP